MANPLHSIKSKLLIFGFCISLIPIAIITNIFYFYASSVLKKQTLDALTAVAESRKAHVFEFIEGRKARAMDFASDGFIRDNLEEINRGESLEQYIAIALNRHLLENKKPLDPFIERIDIVDLDGRIVASYHGPRIGRDLLEVDQHTTAYMRAISKNYTETCIGEPYYSHPQNVYSICVAAPITSRSNSEPLGMLINHYNLAPLNDITMNREGMGKTGEVYLVNSDGMMLTESRFIEDAPLRQKVNTEPVRKAVEGGEEMTGIYRDYRDVSIVGASMYLPEYGWTLLAEIDKSEAFAPLRTLSIVALVVGLVSGAASISVGIVFAFSASRSIRKLTDATRRIAGGDLRSDIKITSRDEIGQLANSFNTMVHSLKQAQEELVRKEKFATIGRISGSIAHDVRHPLATIKNSAYFLNMTLKDPDEKTKKHLKLINSEVVHANEIITNLMRLSELKKPEKSKTNINELVNDFFSVFPLPERIKLVAEFDNKYPDILVDRSHLKQIFTNLVSNAVRAMPEGGTLTIKTRHFSSVNSHLEKENPLTNDQEPMTKFDFVEISFADTGSGMKKEILEKIFEPFFTTGSKGMGLGLSIVKDIIASNDGIISIESEEGKGSTFKMVFPGVRD